MDNNTDNRIWDLATGGGTIERRVLARNAGITSTQVREWAEFAASELHSLFDRRVFASTVETALANGGGCGGAGSCSHGSARGRQVVSFELKLCEVKLPMTSDMIQAAIHLRHVYPGGAKHQEELLIEALKAIEWRATVTRHVMRMGDAYAALHDGSGGLYTTDDDALAAVQDATPAGWDVYRNARNELVAEWVGVASDAPLVR